MTDSPVDDPDTLRSILANTGALLLDFDGPICSVFAGFPAHVVADQLRDILDEGGHRNLPDEVAKSEDPFDVLKYASTLGTNELRYIEAAFRAHEAEAISTATPTPGAHELICRWKATNLPLAIVSNNSITSINAYLKLHKLHSKVDYIAARTNADVDLLKPSPYLVNRALRALEAGAANATLIGDSVTDIKAAQAAGIRSIGYANKPEKVIKLSTAGADAITTEIINMVKV